MQCIHWEVDAGDDGELFCRRCGETLQDESLEGDELLVKKLEQARARVGELLIGVLNIRECARTATVDKVELLIIMGAIADRCDVLLADE